MIRVKCSKNRASCILVQPARFSDFVGLSDEFDREVSEEKSNGNKKAFLVLSVAAFDLAVVARVVWSDQFIPDSQLSCWRNDL